MRYEKSHDELGQLTYTSGRVTITRIQRARPRTTRYNLQIDGAGRQEFYSLKRAKDHAAMIVAGEIEYGTVVVDCPVVFS